MGNAASPLFCGRRTRKPGSAAVLALLLVLTPNTAGADVIRVACAANFLPTLKALVPAFETTSGHRVRITAGATGQLATQILQGAPFDLFLAADRATPRMLAARGRLRPDSLTDYAIGQLVVWRADARPISVPADLRQARRIAIADPDIAPYGAAARQTLTTLGLWEHTRERLVIGLSVAQALHFIRSGGAPLGFVGLAQVRALAITDRGSHWPVPQAHHEPLIQTMGLIDDATAGAESLHAYLRSPPARERIRQAGYRLPEPRRAAEHADVPG